MTDPIRIILADDHTLVRAGLLSLLQKSRDVVVVAEASNGREALRLIEEHQPDIVLVDISMPELNGLDVAAHVKRDWPYVRVVMLSMHANEEYVLQALRSGAVGYLLKDSSMEELGLAIKAVMRGETYLSPAISRHVVDDYLRRVGEMVKDEDQSPFVQLTARQREVLQLIAEGNSTKEIAAKLNISIKTVETHRAHLMERLNIHDVAGLVRYAIRIGLITSQP